MDISCEMELPFSEASSLSGSSFENPSTDKLTDDVDNLLHSNSDKHLSAADFKLDLGPANDLVSDFGISSDRVSPILPEEPAEGYSISDAALEGGIRPICTANNVVAIDNINYVQSFPLVSTLPGLQAVQVIPFGYLISGSKPDSVGQNISGVSLQKTSDLSLTTPTHIQTVHNAVVISNLMMLKSVQGKEEGNEKSVVQNGSRSMKVKPNNGFCEPSISSDVMKEVVNKRKQMKPYHNVNGLRKSSTQKNTKVKIDGKTISLTFEVKDLPSPEKSLLQNSTISTAIEKSSSANSTVQDEENVRKEQSLPPKTPPSVQIVTNVKKVINNTKYVSLLNGNNNKGPKLCNIDKEIGKNDNTEVPNRKTGTQKPEENKVPDQTEELEKEVLNLLAKASVERSKAEKEQSKGTPGRKKSGKPCGNLPYMEELFKCKICGLEFNRHGNFTRHKLIHDVRYKDRYKCSDCDKTFLQRCDLKRHQLIHSNQEPYRCQECGKGYIRRSDLVVHMRFHKKEKVFSCPYCSDRKFCQIGDLNRHVRNVHLHSKSFKCDNCGKQFSKESSLLQHQFIAHQNSLPQNVKKKNRNGMTNSSRVKSIAKKRADES